MLQKCYTRYIGRRGTQEQTIPRQARYLARSERGRVRPGIYTRGTSWKLEPLSWKLDSCELEAVS